MPTILTFIEVVQEGPHADHLLDELGRRLPPTAHVLSEDGLFPVHFPDDRPETEQRQVVTTALDTIDQEEKRQPGDWRNHLVVTDVRPPSPPS